MGVGYKRTENIGNLFLNGFVQSTAGHPIGINHLFTSVRRIKKQLAPNGFLTKRKEMLDKLAHSNNVLGESIRFTYSKSNARQIYTNNFCNHI